MILSARKSADRIRLTALPKPISSLGAAGRQNAAFVTEIKKSGFLPKAATHYFFILAAPFVVSGEEYFFGVQTAGSLKFPSRSTARRETASGLALSR
jgi:hypothetical protein